MSVAGILMHIGKISAHAFIAVCHIADFIHLLAERLMAFHGALQDGHWRH